MLQWCIGPGPSSVRSPAEALFQPLPPKAWAQRQWRGLSREQYVSKRTPTATQRLKQDYFKFRKIGTLHMCWTPPFQYSWMAPQSSCIIKVTHGIIKQLQMKNIGEMIPENSKKHKLNLPSWGNYLHSVYIVFTTIYIASISYYYIKYYILYIILYIILSIISNLAVVG